MIRNRYDAASRLQHVLAQTKGGEGEPFTFTFPPGVKHVDIDYIAKGKNGVALPTAPTSQEG